MGLFIGFPAAMSISKASEIRKQEWILAGISEKPQRPFCSRVSFVLVLDRKWRVAE
jgi:hypothetical protein